MGRLIVAALAVLLSVIVAALFLTGFGQVLLALAVLGAGSALSYYRRYLGKAAAARNRTRTLRLRIACRLRPGPGFTSIADLLWRWSRMRAVFGHGRHSRPGSTLLNRLKSHPGHYAVALGRAHWFKRVFASLEDLTLLISPPRGGKSAYLAGRVIDHPGSLIVTSTRADIYGYTHQLRRRLGPVYVFNPQGIGGIKSTFRWDVVAGCEDPEVACRRAASLTGHTYEHGDMQFWQSKASVALAALLHAAAVGGQTIAEVFNWVCREGDGLAESFLRSDIRASGPLLATLLEIRKQGRMAESVRGTMATSVNWVAVPQLAEAATPGPEGFDVAEFVRRNGTVYMIGAGDQSPVAPLFAAFAEHVHYTAGLIGSHQLRGRLDPPLLIALDEVTQICPVPLSKWVGDSGGKGIALIAVAHSRSQLRERWGEAGAHTIWACCGVKVVLGGITDSDMLSHISQLYGDIPLQEGEGKDRLVRVLPPELLHQLPDARALVIRRNMAPLIVKLKPVWKRRDVRRAMKTSPETVVAAPATVSMTAPVKVLPRTAPFPAADAKQPVLTGAGNGNGHKQVDSQSD